VTEHVIIDGNNLLHAMHAHAPMPHMGRETLLRIIERWAVRTRRQVTLVYDGARPAGDFARQFQAHQVNVQFSAPRTADDLIADLIGAVRDAGRVRVVSSDLAVRRDAVRRRCGYLDCPAFVAELLATKDEPSQDSPAARPPEASADKPTEPNADLAREWMAEFGVPHDDEPFEGHDAMLH
jgi:predicted RNA-binding protein with PIN domain